MLDKCKQKRIKHILNTQNLHFKYVSYKNVIIKVRNKTMHTTSEQ